MEFIKNHKATVAVAIVCFILVILAGFAVYRMFYPSSDKSVYGDRLENAPEIDNAVIEQIKNEMEKTGLITSVEYKTNVRTMKFFVDVKTSTKIKDAEKIATIILEKLSTKVIGFYDITIYFTQTDGSSEEYPAIAYHSKDSEAFHWVTNKAGEVSE